MEGCAPMEWLRWLKWGVAGFSAAALFALTASVALEAIRWISVPSASISVFLGGLCATLAALCCVLDAIYYRPQRIAPTLLLLFGYFFLFSLIAIVLPNLRIFPAINDAVGAGPFCNHYLVFPHATRAVCIRRSTATGEIYYLTPLYLMALATPLAAFWPSKAALQPPQPAAEDTNPQ
jgi:hypothetical protein